MNRQQYGNQAEQQARRFLARQGLKYIHANYRCRSGEIDLIMRDADTLVFVEVRLRTHPGFGDALASIGPNKQQRLRRAAQRYLQQHAWPGPCRFDAVGLNGTDRIDWVKNAF